MIRLITVLFFAVLSARSEAAEPTISFVALGDAPYGNPELTHKKYLKLIKNINEEKAPLVIHVGDTHGYLTCDDALTDKLRGYMNEIEAPVLYTPGDNEWTDCRYIKTEKFDPEERLAYIRKTHFGTGTTLGKSPLPVKNQAERGYPENARLVINNIGFVTVHVVGSNNNFLPFDLSAVKEFMARNAANVEWLNESFDLFQDTDAIVVALHADMFVRTSGFKRGWKKNSPFRDIGLILGKRSSALKKPVLLLYGDSHKHKNFQPFPKRKPYLHAIEVYGSPDIKAIKIAVRPKHSSPFWVTKVIEP